MSRITTRTLRCGMPLIVEQIDGVKSAGVSWLIPAGSATDPDHLQGLCALWSELLFRGAGDLDSRQHADAMDHLGVNRSADVGTHHIRLGMTLLGDRLHDAVPLLVDMVRRPRLDPDMIDPARDLALQSLESLKDDPRERAVIAVRARHHPAPINRSGMGTVQGLTDATRQALAEHWNATARPIGSILAVAGAVDPDAVARRFDDLLDGWTGEAPPVVPGPTPQRGYAHEQDDSNQVQVILMHDAPPEADDRSILERVVTSVLSGGMSSRLFTEVREKRGLCYSVSAGYAAGRDRGSVLAYVGTAPDRAQESLDVLTAELQRINSPDGTISRDEFDRAIIGLKSRLVFAGESTSARAAALASDQFKLGRPRSLDEMADRVDAVTLEQVNDHLAGRSLGKPTLQTLGPNTLTPPAPVSNPA